MHQRTLFLTLFVALLPVVLLAEPPRSPGKTMKYMVKNGDCLWTISREVLNDPLKWPMVYRANEGKIRDPNLIYPGQSFAIPPPSAITKAALREATQEAYAKLGSLPAKNPSSRMTQKKMASPAEASPPEQALPKEEAAVPAKETKAEKAPPTAGTVPPSDSSSTMGLLVLVLLLAAIGGFFFWKKMGPGPSESQEPRPLSSFPEVRNVTPMPSAPPKEAPLVEPPMRSGVITSVSVPSEPAQPVRTPAMPETQAPAVQPAHLPTGPQAGRRDLVVPSQGVTGNGDTKTGSAPPAQSADKPGDNNPPPASSGHAA